MNRILVLAACAAFALAGRADTHTWIGGNSSGGGWNTAANWKNEAGENECPSAGDTALFNVWNQTNVVTDADFALFNSMAIVLLNSYSWVYSAGATLILDTTGDALINTAIRGSSGGYFIKRGANRVEFTSTNESGIETPYSTYGVYALAGSGLRSGIRVEKGTLVLVQSAARTYYYRDVDVAEGATLVVSSNEATCVRALYGKGTVINEGTTVRNLQIYYPDNPGTWKELVREPVFEGKLTGAIAPYVYGREIFTGTESDCTGSATVLRGWGCDKPCGWLYAKRIGKTGEAGSLGTGDRISLFFGGNFGYLGDGTPEETDRQIVTEARAAKALTPQYFDAGTNGNLTLTGTIRYDNYGTEYNMRSFVFSGSNAAPCTVSGAFGLNYTDPSSGYNYNWYVRKEGPGTWQFRKNKSTTFKGVWDVREGTLRFDSIAETNVVSALGLSTRLTDEFTGKYDSSHDSIYAFRVGRTNLVGAADAVFEFDGAEAGTSKTRPMLLTGDAHLRANGAAGAALTFGDVRAAQGATTLVLDGTNTDDNALYDLQNGNGVVSVVKDGPGTWILRGNQTFSGDLAVKAGTLVAKANPIHTWFRFVSTDGYGSPYNGYIDEVALYDADGNRLNLDLAFELPAGKTWTNVWYPTIADNLLVKAGYASFCQGADTDIGCAYYLYEKNPVSMLFDGTSVAATFSSGMTKTNAVIMHLTNTAQIASVDISQDTGNYLSAGYQTTSAFRLDGSADGVHWKTLVETNNLPISSYGKWYFSNPSQGISSYGRAVRKLSEGQGLALASPAYDDEGVSMLESVQYVSVATGATLRTEGFVTPTISKIRIDGASGAGTLAGFAFATDMTVDVVGIPRTGDILHLPVDFTGVEGFDDVAQWSFTVDGTPRATYLFALKKTGIDIIPKGLVILIR